MTTPNSGSQGPSAVATDAVPAEVYVAGTRLGEVQVMDFSIGDVVLVYTFDGSNVAYVGAIAVSWTETACTSDGTRPFGEPFTRFDGLTVRTASATGAGARSVTLNEPIDAEGVDSSNHAEYGTGLTYGSRTSEIGVGTGGSVVVVVAAIAALSPNLTCHHRVVGSNGFGCLAGRDQTSMTSTAPAAVDTSSALRPCSATVHGSTNASSSRFANHHIEYGTTMSYAVAASTETSPSGGLPGLCFGCDEAEVSEIAQLSGPEPATLHHFRIMANPDGVGGTHQTFVIAAGAAAGAMDATAKHAMLREPIDARPVAASYHFNYDLTVARGSSTWQVDGGPGDGEWWVTTQISGLRLVGGTVTTFGAAGTHQFEVAALDGSYAVVTVGGKSLTPNDWAQSGFIVRVADDGEGTFALTVNDGGVSRRIAVAVFTELDNRVSVPSRSVAATEAASSVGAPGPGKRETAGARAVAARTTDKKAGEVTGRLNRAGIEALNKAKSNRLKVEVGVRCTPAGDMPAVRSWTVIFHCRAGR